jgi:RimJ/RimL family protein N-acetyltransferase
MDNMITTPRGIITIRPAQEVSAQAFRTLRLEAVHLHPEAFGAEYAAEFGHPATFWEERLHSAGSEGTVFFATQNESFIGMCGIQRRNSPKIKHSAIIWGVYVQADWRGLQIAERLIASCTGWAQTQGIKIVKLAVVNTNTAAIRCYASCGFKVYGIEPQALCYNGVMYDELLMARSI